MAGDHSWVVSDLPRQTATKRAQQAALRGFLESACGLCRGADVVEQIWVYGNSYESFLVAVVVPNKRELLAWAKEQGGLPSDFCELCDTPQVCPQGEPVGIECVGKVLTIAPPRDVRSVSSSGHQNVHVLDISNIERVLRRCYLLSCVWFAYMLIVRKHRQPQSSMDSFATCVYDGMHGRGLADRQYVRFVKTLETDARCGCHGRQRSTWSRSWPRFPRRSG